VEIAGLDIGGPDNEGLDIDIAGHRRTDFAHYE